MARTWRNVMAAMVFGASVSVVLAHSYRLDDTNEFIVEDGQGVRRIVVTRGTSFRLSVIDNGGCSADIRATKGNKRIASVANPNSAGFVVNHTFDFTAVRAGTTTYDISVRGEAFNGGQAHCDENSHNAFEINVVDPGGDDRSFVSAVRPEIKTLKQGLKQLQADLRSQYGVILGDVLANRVTVAVALQQMMFALNLSMFGQRDLAQGLIRSVRENAASELLADPVRSRVPVPTGLLRGGCGGWDDFMDDVNLLMATSFLRTKSDTKRTLARLISEYERDGGLAEFTMWFDCDDCYDCDGVSYEDDDDVEKPGARISSILSIARRDTPLDPLVREVFLGVGTRGSGLSSLDTILSRGDQEVSRQSQVLIESRFVSVHTLPQLELGIDFRAAFEASGAESFRGDRARFQAPLFLITPTIVGVNED